VTQGKVYKAPNTLLEIVSIQFYVSSQTITFHIGRRNGKGTLIHLKKARGYTKHNNMIKKKGEKKRHYLPQIYGSS